VLGAAVAPLTLIPGLAALAIVAAVMAALITYEAVRFAEARARIRGAAHPIG